MDRPTGIGAALRRFGIAVAALAVGGPGCILDFDGLTGSGTGGVAGAAGNAGSGGATTGTGGTTTDSGGTGGAACGLLDCCPEGQVLELAQGPKIADLPRGLVVRDDGVYWTNLQGGNVVRLAAAGGGVTPLAEADQPRALATSGSELVWSAKDGVHACALPGCGDAHLVVASLAPDSVRAVAYDGATLLFTDRGSGVNDGRARSCALDGCAPIDLGDGMIAAEGALLYGAFAFWTDEANGNMNGTVQRAPKDVASLTQLAAELEFPVGLAADDMYIYWTEQLPAGHVYRCPLMGGYCSKPEDIAPAADPLGRPTDIQVAGGRVYWTNADDGSIVSCPEPGCGAAKPKVHVTGRQGLTRIAVGSKCLFWTENAGGGAVLKTAR